MEAAEQRSAWREIRTDLLWRLGLNDQVSEPRNRSCEIRNFIDELVLPHRSRPLRDDRPIALQTA